MAEERIQTFRIVNTTTELHNIFNDLKKGAVADHGAMTGLVNEMIHCVEMACKMEEKQDDTKD